MTNSTNAKNTKLTTGAAACLLLLFTIASAPRDRSKAPPPLPSAGSSAHPAGYLVKADFKDKWPLTVDAGTVKAESFGKAGNVENTAVTFTTPEGETYAINGVAITHAKEKGWKDLSGIWAKNPKGYIGGPNMDISPILNTGLKMVQ